MTDTFARMRQLVGTTAEWAANDLVIGNGEIALERVAGGALRMKVGNGVDKYSVLQYFDPGIFSYVLRAGDTMTGPLVVPQATINLGGLQVTAGNSSFAAPIALGPNATTAEPGANDNSAKVPTTHWVRGQMAGIITGLEYKGTWNAATNTPPLASGGLGVPTPTRGDFYMVSVAGNTELDGITVWAAGDFVAFNGIAWQRVPQPLTFDQIVAGLGYTPANKAGDTFGGPIGAPSVLVSGTAPASELRKTDNGADLKRWDTIVAANGDWQLRALSDAGAVLGSIVVKRDGTIVSPTPSLIPNHLSGMRCQQSGAGPTYTAMSITAGLCADSANAAMMQLAATWTKTIGGAWIAGNGGAGLGAGVTAVGPKTLHLFAIKLASGATDFYFDTSNIAANKPAGVTAWRRIRSVLVNASSQIIPDWDINGRRVLWRSAPADYSGANFAHGTNNAFGVTVPAGISCRALINFSGSCNVAGTQYNMNIWPSMAGSPFPLTTGQGTNYASFRENTGGAALASQIDCDIDGTNGGAPTIGISINNSQNSSIIGTLITFGYEDNRGRD